MNWADFAAALLPVPHTISGEAYAGSGAFGDVYAAAVSITPCVVEHTRRRVRIQTQDAAGAEVLSSTTVFCPPATVLPAGSRVTLTGGTVAKVLASTLHQAVGWDIPEHVELNLE